MMSKRFQTKGFTLIASLMLLLLLSGIAIGLMMMVTTEGKVGGTDLQNNVAYHSAEGGIEKMTSDLASTFQNAQSPTPAQICNLSTLQPTMVGVTWKDYTVAPSSGCSNPLAATFGQISSGPNQGLWAQIIPINMLATAAEPGGQEVSMTRSAQVALIPVFQFGVFSDSDLAFFSGPSFDFAGSVHTNGDLYPEVGPGSTLTFHDKVSAYGNVVRANLPNGYTTASKYNGTVMVPTAAQGCDGTQPNCRAIGLTEGSVTGAGGIPPQSGQNSGWPSISLSTYNSEIIDGNYGNSGGTGSKKLQLPFVNGTNCPGAICPFQIIRRPPAGESASSSLGQSREYNLAQIHVLLTDDPAELPGGAADTANNIRLANVPGSNVFGIPTSVPSTMPVLAAGTNYTTMFAAGFTYIADPSSCAGTWCAAATLPQDWPFKPQTPPAGAQTLVPTGPPAAPVTLAGGTPAPTLTVCNNGTCVSPYYSTTANAANAAAWNLVDGYIRVEYKDVSGNWHPVTMEWLKLGFARGQTPPTALGGNPINPNAILLLQEPADRNGDGNIDTAGLPPKCLRRVSGTCTQWSYALPPEVVPDNGSPTASGSPWYGITNAGMVTNGWTGSNYYPINFYDAREGEVRDNDTGDNTCTSNGIMNAVEIDVGNLKQWLTGAIGTSGTSVDYVAQNGYVLYFSDRRGMMPNPNAANVKTGDSGLEDDVNASSAAGTPNATLEPRVPGQVSSPEDVNQNNVLDEFGTTNMGLGFFGSGGVANRSLNATIIAAAPDNPYVRMDSCGTTGRKNWVSGARHVLRLVDGTLGNVPLRTDTTTPSGGFTVASENPVYILGDYNSSSADPTWTGGADLAGHAASAVIADAVTVLSNNWSDLNSMNLPTKPGNRNAGTTYYRVAIAGGKNMNFPQPTWGASQDFGTDGGVHNFLRYLENWGGASLNYKGSLVSLFYSTYATGVFKCCTTVYSPPTRNYSFDVDFSNPAGLPPGTPLFRDVDSLGYRQLFTSRAN